MQINIEDAGPCKKTIKIEAEAEHVKEEIVKSFDELHKNLTLPGFRKGKVPRKLIEKRYGEQVHEEAKGKLLAESFEKALEEHNLKPVSTPEPEDVVFEPEEGKLSFTVTIEVLPEFELPEYKGLRVSRPEVNVTGEDVDNTIEMLLRQHAEWRPTEGPIEEKDLVLADVKLEAGGAEIAHLEDAGVAPSIGSVAGLPVGDALKENIVGKNTGDVVTLEITIPAAKSTLDVPEEFHGKTGILTITPKDLKRMHLPKPEDALFEEFDADSDEELAEEIRKGLTKEREAAADGDVENAILDKLLASLEFDLPEEMLKKEADILAEKNRMQLSMKGKSEEEIEKEMEGFHTRSLDELKDAFKAQLLMRRIADKEKIFCTEEDIASRITSLAYAYGHTPEELFELYEKRGWMNTLREEIRAEKVRNFLREKAEIVDKEIIEKEKADEEKEPVTKEESTEKEEPPAEEGLGLGA